MKHIPAVVEVSGFVLILAGISWLSIPAGLIAGGALLILASYAMLAKTGS